VDLETLMRIGNLELRAGVVVQVFWSGLHRSPYHGFSVEFTEYRQYTPGDDPRYVDWRVFARSDRYFVKRFEDETNLRCHLLVDQSCSMGFGSLSYSKVQYATTFAATMAHFIHGQRDAVGLITFDEDVVEYLPARYRPGHLHRLMLALERPVHGRATDLAAPLRHVAELVIKRGLMVLVSDLLAPIDALETHLGYLRARGHEIVIFQVLDPAELSLGFDEPAIFHDMESGRDLYVDPATARRDYETRIRRHNESVHATCDQLGIEYHQLITDQPLELALFDYLRGRLERGRVTTRRVNVS
jgi:uncharacterized protein (DUF58 family)